MSATRTFRDNGRKRGVGSCARIALLVCTLLALLLINPSAAFAQGTYGCATRGAVPAPAMNPGLVQDCEILIGSRDMLRGAAPLNWRVNLPISQWDGITVSRARGGQRVTGLLLRERGLDGSIPGDLGRLTELEVLDLQQNQLKGYIPSELGNLIRLRVLDLFGNLLGGGIPSTLGNFTNLERLHLDTNLLSGSIPPSLGNLTNLRHFDLSQNSLSGSLPPSLGNLIYLRYFNVRDNDLSGPIPLELGNLVNLRELWLSSNQFSGRIPVTFVNLVNLRKLVIHNNNLTGEVPTEIAEAVERPGDILRIQRHDDPAASFDLGIGWVSRDGSRVVMVGVIRDQTLGQTYYIARLEGSPRVVRRWISPTSPLVGSVNWPLVNTRFTVPVEVIRTIELDERLPEHNMLVRRFDGGDDRIFAYDATIARWRHIPDWPTFQALGFYWCDVTAADSGFFDRITIGPPYPATLQPARANYPNCRT